MSGHSGPCKTSRFVVRGGQVITDGKSNYPNYLILELDRQEAWRVIRELTHGLELGGVLPLTFFGKLAEEDE